MKKLILFVLFAISIDVAAQRPSKSRFKLGGKVGMTIHTLTGGQIKSGTKASFVGGVWCQIKMSRNWTSQAEIIYVEKGTGNYDHNRPRRIGDYVVAIMYLEVPILFQYHLKGFAFEFGPGLGALTYQYEYLYGVPTPNMTGAYPFTTKEFSFNIGVGYSFNEKWYLGLRFTHSLLPVRKQLPYISKQVYNRVFAVTLSRQLKVKMKKAQEAGDRE